MQLQALRENVPAHLQDQVLASNRPLRILADAIEAHRRANTGAGSGGGKGGVAGTGGSAPHISPGRRKPGGGKKEGSVQKTGTTVIVKKEAGRDERALEGRNGGAGGVSAEPQVGPAHVVKQEGPEGKPTGAGPRTLAGAEREGSKREPLLRGAAKSKGALALPQETVPLGAAFAPPQKLVESGAHKSSSPRNEGCVPQGFELAKDGVKLEEDPIQTETGTLAGDSEKPVKSILPDVILEEAAGMRSGHAEGGAALTFKGLPSVR